MLPDAVLDALPARMSIEYFRRGSRLIEPGRDNHHLYVLRSGAAEVHDAQGSLVDRGGEGSCFGSISLTQGNRVLVGWAVIVVALVGIGAAWVARDPDTEVLPGSDLPD